VQVRLVTDETNGDEDALLTLRQAGIPVAARPDEGWGIMHNKFVVVDSTWIWSGSWNLTSNGTYRNNNNAIIIASRALAEDYTVEFEELFSGLYGASSPANTPNPVIDLNADGETVRVEVYFAPEDGAGDHLINTLSSARSSVRFMSFVFTSGPIADALIDLQEAGITVQGIVEDRSADDRYSQVDRLRAGGVDVLPDGNPYIMHHKVFIIDDQTVVMGSYNFTNSAEERNDENLLIIHDPDVAAAFLAEFGRVLQEAQSAGH
jgi:phosphatidylserine/phosphatidylglycerophosphate/cardiolipin synthase-like enzyme